MALSNFISADRVCAAFTPGPPPPWLPFREGIAKIGGANLYYRDSGGDGVPVILVHPLTGSALVWSYQQPALVHAGYRVIAYSRRGHHGSSSAAAADDRGVPARDLKALADFLGVGKFVVIACAAGTAVAVDFAIDHSDRLLALVLAAGSYLDTEEPEYQKLKQHVRVAGFHALPSSFRELSPSYRAANVDGTAAWEALEHSARAADTRSAKGAHKLTWANLARIRAATLFIAGGADLAAPPTMMCVFAQHVPEAEMVVMPDVGHSVYWEQPEVFNRRVLEFLHRRARG